MEKNIYLVSLFGAILFFIIKFFESRIILKEKKQNIKMLIRNTLVVYISILAGGLIVEQLSSFKISGGDINQISGSADIFLNEPPF
jgi:hypothetical protein